MDDQNYLQKQRKRLSQKRELLASNPGFQKDIASLRIKWNIPYGGIQSDEESEKWYHHHYEQADKHGEEVWPKQKLLLENLRKEKKFREAEELKKEFNVANPI